MRDSFQLDRWFGAPHAPPMHPARFELELGHRAFTDALDRPLAIECYGHAFASVATASVLDGSSSAWSDLELATLAEALPTFHGLTTVSTAP